MDKDNWVVFGKKLSDEGTINLGNFKTSNEAKALVDFLRAGMQSYLTSAQILNTYTAIENSKKTDES